jgi:neutral ceramidase
MLRFVLCSAAFVLLAVGLSSSQVEAQAGQAPSLRVGAARVDITPPPPEGNRVRDRLYVSAIVVDNGSTKAVLVGADQISFGTAIWADVTRRLSADFGIAPEHVLTSATHTHSDGRFGVATPGGRGAAPAGPAAPAGRGTGPAAPGAAAGRGSAPGGGAAPSPVLADATVQAVGLALKRLRPARVGYNAGESYFNVNRDALHPETKRWYQGPNPDGVSDKTMAVLSFTTVDGAPIALFVNYAMHPINFYLRGFVSADTPGEAARWVERVYGDDVVVVWTQGASGDQNPAYLRPGQAFAAAQRAGGPPEELARAEATFDSFIKATGAVLGEEIIRVSTGTTRMAGDLRMWSGHRMVTCPGRTRLDNAREGVAGQYEDGPPVDIRVGLLVLGSTALVSVNAEIYTGIGSRIKAASPLRDTVVVSLANGSAGSGYVPTEEAFYSQTFQVLGSRLKPGCAEDAVVGAALDLLSAAAR